MRIHEEIARGPDGYSGSAITVRRYLRTIHPARGRVYQEVHYEPAQAMQVDWGECGCVQIGTTTRKVSVFVAVLCYSRLIYIEFTLSQAPQGGVLPRNRSCPRVFWRQSPCPYLRQFEGGRAQWLGAQRLLPSRVPGAVRLLLSATDRLPGARPGIKGNRRRGCALRKARMPWRDAPRN